MVSNIIFDWSGVLSDDIVPVYNAAMTVFEKVGVEKISFEEFKKEFELPVTTFLKKYTQTKLTDDLIKTFAKAINSNGWPRPFPGAKELIDLLKKNKTKIAILSSHPEEKVKEYTEKYGFSGFVCVRGSVMDKREVISKFIEKIGFDKETLLVGDMVHDIEAGKVAGIKTAAVTWGYQDSERLAKAEPDFIINSFDELKKIIL